MKKLAVVAVLAAVAGCGDTINNTYVTSDGGSGSDANGTCTPNTKECVTSKVARICAADGSGWVSQQCDVGEVCSGGDCTLDPNVACTPGVDIFCADATHALVCNDNGMGFKTVSCPSNTTCGGGVCVGSCNVGESFCLDINTVITCMNGTSYTTTTCNRGSTACVTTGTTPVNTAACMPAQCTPDPTGCDNVCGNKPLGNGNMDTGFLSFCQETSQGYKWAAIQCPSPTSCNPTGATCTGGSQAGCTSECTPGELRCTANGLGTQACGSNGKWGTSTNCTPTATGDLQVCVQPLSGNAICGDPVCAAGAVGACASDGFHPCVNGKVSATGSACAMGICTPDQNLGTFGKWTAGSCVAECQSGDKRCVNGSGSSSFQTCGANGVWSASAMTCASGLCQDFTDSTTGRPNTICGACPPGGRRCTDNTGAPNAPGSDIETCDNTGAWGPHAACAIGTCKDLSSGPSVDAACVADCVPNQPICLGAAKTTTGAPHAGTAAVGTCSATGTLPGSSMPCTGNTSCRKGPSGVPVVSTNTPAACVECVGPSIAGGNENGLVDTTCPSGTSIATCQANNTFPAGTACPGGTSCTAEAGSIVPESCGPCGPFANCTDSAIKSLGITQGCGAVGGLPVSCGGFSDCCDTSCNPAQFPSPATCQ
jgi:hypothetical protein